jgi:hypothetical protein
MLLKNRTPGIEHEPFKPLRGLEHLRSDWVAIVRWLKANKVEHVLIGGVAEAIRGNTEAAGPVAIVPAPYRRNLERLSRALSAAHARVRVDAPEGSGADSGLAKVTAEKLAERVRWTFRCGTHDLDVESGIQAAGGSSGFPSYQELVYEANRFEIGLGLSVEVASPEDIEHFKQLRRTGVAPEITIKRQGNGVPPAREPQEQARSPQRDNA